ncbi:hypothetical protein NHX12_026524 [Muraenolepis orangiensis]|uniref:Uncharacterized protein n=1 Tax=Muraenolepis orangiensis TaxID=630683 RepID=A0A9Q0EGR9_9TELE|nr:hypothetical protein NHX12_026524 [Muraenolepis orangiensis]
MSSTTRYVTRTPGFRTPHRRVMSLCRILFISKEEFTACGEEEPLMAHYGHEKTEGGWRGPPDDYPAHHELDSKRMNESTQKKRTQVKNIVKSTALLQRRHVEAMGEPFRGGRGSFLEGLSCAAAIWGRRLQ